ncbi:PREDICTED: uncharacterized protein K02A2.6-like [Vollenhovia emeryi]|uniref:uncharacterized protein K02A2.6-like n=1 Tax=Vollenhovia emeryi TaxID=411798 RepID=UPI0005F5373F|nr:PREDICTED: uncharacterized protein K02A2.6-like [Vollenhovia emeryi]
MDRARGRLSHAIRLGRHGRYATKRPGRLKGHARQWYDTRPRLAITWTEMKESLKQQFCKSVPFSKLFKEAALYESAPGQALGDYCFQKLNKMRKLDIIPDKYLIDAVIGGITDESVARTVRSAQHCDANALYVYMMTLGNLSSKGEKNKTAAMSSFRNERKSQSSGRAINQSQVKEDENTKPTDGNTNAVKCFNCGKEGHIAKKCRMPRIECEQCHRLGHNADKCASRKDVNAVTERKRSANLYERPVIVNGHKIDGLLDTGSSCSLLRKSVAERWNIPISITPVLRGFAGQVATSNQAAACNIRVMNATAQVDAVVVPDNQLVYDIIVGRDFLEQEHIVSIKRGNKLTLEQLPTLDTELEAIGDVNFAEITNDAVNINVESEEAKPAPTVVYRPYRLAEAEKQVVRGIIRELLTNNIIRESNLPYASPILLVKKKNGEYRMCVDFRKLNLVTIKDKYPMPLIEEQIDKLRGYRYFTGLDLALGYYQVPVAAESIEKTAFVTPEGHYEFLRMPFGLANAPAVFQRLMDNVLGDLKVAFPYLDDIIIPSKTIAEGMVRLRQVLDALRRHHLTLKLEKCFFFTRSIEYLGREISEHGVRPGRRKIEAVLDMEAPKSVKQVRQFLGLAGYFRRFVENFATIVEPLTRLTKKNSHWEWKNEHERAFDTIKTKLTTRPVLAIFNPEIPAEVHTDASAIGIGAILLQRVDGGMAVVAYYSRHTTVDQRCYHSYELETMAVVFAMRHFRVYLLGTKFKVVTDCNALRTTFAKRDLLPRIGRWWLEVQEYTFEIEHRAGTRMAHVDALSRNPIQVSLEVLQVDITEGDWVLAAQLQDDQISRIRTILLDKKRTNETKHYFKEYLLKDDKVYRRLDDHTQAWVVPRDARMQICRLCHDDAGHLGVEKTLERVKRNYWFAVPSRIISDRGTTFTSQTFRTFCNTYGIRHVLNAVATPRANGQCERYNKTIVQALATTTAGHDPRDWDLAVKKIQSALNTTYNKGINTTPTKALIGCETRSAAEAPLLSQIQDVVHRLDFNELRDDIKAHTSKEQRAQKERYDRTRRDATKYDEGTLVLVQITSEPATGTSRKLYPKFKGPFRVRKVLINDRYEVEDLREGHRRKRTVAAADRMKPWITVQDE